MTMHLHTRSRSHHGPAGHRLKSWTLAGLMGLLALGAPLAWAHDTWFEPQTGPDGTRLLALGTGNQFPVQETGVGAEYLQARGCITRAQPASEAVLKPLRNIDRALLLSPPAGAVNCWVQLSTFDVEVPPDKVPLYLKEVQATPELRQRWAEMQARGAVWTERYTKHARILLDTTVAAPAGAAGQLGMDLLLQPTARPLRAGDVLVAQVLRDGKPLAGQAVELRGDASPLGIWRRSDEQGRIRVPVPLAGRWVLRAVDLRVSTERPDSWDSRFVTLAFEVAKADAKAADSAALRTASASD